MRSFWFHYNKPASRAAGEPRLTVHYKGVCHVVAGIDCRVPVKTRNRNTQPRCVVAGRTSGITFTADNIAIIE